MEVDERNPLLHREPEPHVLVVCLIPPSVSVPKQAIVAECVVVWSRFALHHRYSRDAQRDRVEHLGFEDPLRSDQRDALSVVVESALEDRSTQGAVFPGKSRLFLEEPESRQTNRVVDQVHRSGGHSKVGQDRRSNALFQRFFGSSNFTAAGSKASGSKAPPAHLTIDSCSSWSGSAMTWRNSA